MNVNVTEQRDPMFCAPQDVLTQIKLVCLARQAAVPGQEPDKRHFLIACER